MSRFRGKDYVFDPERGLFGPKPLVDRLAGLEPLRREVRGLSVLDLGCAEGYVVEHFLQGGARLAHGVDSHRRRIAVARRLVRDPRARFEVGDFADWPRFRRSRWLEPAYDVVLLLGVYQQMRPGTRMVALAGMLGLCRRWFALGVGDSWTDLRAEATLVAEAAGFAADSDASTSRALAFRRVEAGREAARADRQGAAAARAEGVGQGR